MSLDLFGDGECGSWPQQQIGMVLWSLLTMGHRWQKTTDLMKMSMLPDNAVSRNPEFVAPILFVWRVLRPLRWFGLVESVRIPPRNIERSGARGPHLTVSCGSTRVS